MHFKFIFFLQVSANEEMDLGGQPVPNYDEDPNAVKEGQVFTEGEWNKRLNSFQKLIFMKMLMQEKVGVEKFYPNRKLTFFQVLSLKDEP